jgi:hypothetical protein
MVRLPFMPDPIAYLRVAKLSLWAIRNSGGFIPVRGATVSRPWIKADACVDTSLPRLADDEGEEGDDEDDDDYEAAAIRPAAIDATLPLIPEFPFVAHFVRS